LGHAPKSAASLRSALQTLADAPSSQTLRAEMTAQLSEFDHAQ